MKRSSIVFALVLLLCSSAWCARTLKDEAGRTVTVPDQVKRVISLAPSVTDTIYSLGASSQFVERHAICPSGR